MPRPLPVRCRAVDRNEAGICNKFPFAAYSWLDPVYNRRSPMLGHCCEIWNSCEFNNRDSTIALYRLLCYRTGGAWLGTRTPQTSISLLSVKYVPKTIFSKNLGLASVVDNNTVFMARHEMHRQWVDWVIDSPQVVRLTSMMQYSTAQR